MDDDTGLGQPELEFAFRMWRENRDRIVGYPDRYPQRNEAFSRYYKMHEINKKVFVIFQISPIQEREASVRAGRPLHVQSRTHRLRYDAQGALNAFFYLTNSWNWHGRAWIEELKAKPFPGVSVRVLIQSAPVDSRTHWQASKLRGSHLFGDKFLECPRMSITHEFSLKYMFVWAN